VIDFNSEPIDPGYSILTRKKLEPSEIEDLNESRSLVGISEEEMKVAGEDDEGAEAPISIDDLATVDELLKKHENTRFWSSVYSNFGSINTDESESGNYGEPRFTDYASQFQGTLDYIFIEKDEKNISVKSILMLPKEIFLKPSLPNKNFGSDHLCLVADLEF
jgi:RNA exonuclease NGL2